MELKRHTGNWSSLVRPVLPLHAPLIEGGLGITKEGAVVSPHHLRGGTLLLLLLPRCVTQDPLPRVMSLRHPHLPPLELRLPLHLLRSLEVELPLPLLLSQLEDLLPLLLLTPGATSSPVSVLEYS